MIFPYNNKSFNFFNTNSPTNYKSKGVQNLGCNIKTIVANKENYTSVESRRVIL